MHKRVMFFIDGENLVFRYQSMLKKGRKPRPGIVHERDVYVWHRDIIAERSRDILRVTYYSSAVGDVEKIRSLSQDMKALEYSYTGLPYGGSTASIYTDGIHRVPHIGNVFPRLFKKENKSAKSKAVDINIAVDMLNYAAPENVDVIFLVSGDGDFIPLLQAVMRRGVQVGLMALSDGLNPDLLTCVDYFEPLDTILFEDKA